MVETHCAVLRNKQIAITGACGTIGAALLEFLIVSNSTDNEIICIDNDETSLFLLEQKWIEHKNIKFKYCDITRLDALILSLENSDIIFHAAAMKHVVVCERSPVDAIENNILGTQNIISAARAVGAQRVLFTSSDKAVNPTNVMGATKLMGERLMTAASLNPGKAGTIFSSTRFGNVLGSNGSVVQVFKNQIEQGSELTITHREMSRFVMSTKDAIKLVVNSITLAYGGEVFITKMPVLKIVDLAKAMNGLLAPSSELSIKYIGAKPGEKFYEELMTQEETSRSLETKDYFIVKPAFSNMYGGTIQKYPDFMTDEVNNCYISQAEIPMSVAEIEDYLQKNAVLINKNSADYVDGQYWEKKYGG